jgi:hypothetical protein
VIERVCFNECAATLGLTLTFKGENWITDSMIYNCPGGLDSKINYAIYITRGTIFLNTAAGVTLVNTNFSNCVVNGGGAVTYYYGDEKGPKTYSRYMTALNCTGKNCFEISNVNIVSYEYSLFLENGAGVFASWASPVVVIDCLFKKNLGYIFAAAMLNLYVSNWFIVLNCVFVRNVISGNIISVNGANVNAGKVVNGNASPANVLIYTSGVIENAADLYTITVSAGSAVGNSNWNGNCQLLYLSIPTVSRSRSKSPTRSPGPTASRNPIPRASASPGPIVVDPEPTANSMATEMIALIVISTLLGLGIIITIIIVCVKHPCAEKESSSSLGDIAGGAPLVPANYDDLSIADKLKLISAMNKK